MHRSRLLTLLSLVIALALPAAAAASPSAVYRDCEDNARLDRRHSDADLRAALRDIPQDIDEYSNCRELISGALAGVNTTGRGSAYGQNGVGGGLPDGLAPGNGVGSVPLGPNGKPLDPRVDAAPDERQELRSAAAGDDIRPTSAGVRPGEPDGDLPVPLLVALALATVALLAAGAPRLRHLGRGRPA